MDRKTAIERESVEIGIDRNGNPKPERYDLKQKPDL